MRGSDISEYNKDQWLSFVAVEKALTTMSSDYIDSLKNLCRPYLDFRESLDRFQQTHFKAFCRRTCFETNLSQCCGFESIFTFFADQVIAYCFATAAERTLIMEVIQKPNRTERCVYLSSDGCLWPITPVSCAMFVCKMVREKIIDSNPSLKTKWEEFKDYEKTFTFPDRPVLFDQIEEIFMACGVDSPFMYYHKSPGLLRVKRRSGLLKAKDGRLPSFVQS